MEGNHSFKYIHSFEQFAKIYFKQGKYSKSIAILHQGLLDMQAVIGLEDTEFYWTLNKLIYEFLNQGFNEQALQLIKAYLPKFFYLKSINCLELLYKRGYIFCLMGSFEEALEAIN